MSLNTSTQQDTQIIQVPFAEHMINQYLNYARDVITSRAVPDVRDGLKPVQRRILYAMHNLGLSSRGGYKKSARTVGETLGTLHPHGDQSTYEALVVMAQDFNYKYPLIDGQGNYGDTDGSPAAAMRYTESRLSSIGETMLQDIEKNVVDTMPNYDNTREEPTVLPTLFPNLIANATSGIAVGMTSGFLPHYVPDVYKAMDVMLEKELAGETPTFDDVFKIIKGPDFPTGGIVTNAHELYKIYSEGQGTVQIRGKHHIEEGKKKYDLIVFTEIPYKVNKSNLIMKIDSVAKEKLPDVNEVRDESDKNGLRIVIEVKKTGNINLVLNTLFKYTELQSSCSVRHTALVNNKPVMNLSLFDLLVHFILHASDVLRRETQYDYEKASNRYHIVSAFLTVLHYETPIAPLMHTATNRKHAIELVKETYNLDDIQAEAIVDMKLYMLSTENVTKYEIEANQLQANIAIYEERLNNNIALLTYVRERLQKAAEPFANEVRKTELDNINTKISEDILHTMKHENIVAIITNNNIIKSIKASDFNEQNRNGKGVNVAIKDDDFIKRIYSLQTSDKLIVVLSSGRIVLLPMYTVPIVSKQSTGKYIQNYISMEEGERVIDVLPITKQDVEDDTNSLCFITKNGRIKRMKLSFLPANSRGKRCITLLEGDSLVNATLVTETDSVLCCTYFGKGLRVGVNKIRCQGPTGSGISFIKFKEADDYVVGLYACKNECLLITSEGYGKRLSMDFINEKKNRNGYGVRVIADGNKIAAFTMLDDEKSSLFITTKNSKLIRLRTEDVRQQQSTSGRGTRLVNLVDDDKVAAITIAPLVEENN